MKQDFPTLISTKITVPPVRRDLVYRDHLVEKLEKSRTKLSLLSAPAGFGKSTLLLDWLQHSGLRFVWFSIDENDNSPDKFFTYLIAAVREIEPSFGNKIVVLLKSPNFPPLQNLLTLLINELSELETKIVLVFDDYHYIRDSEIHTGLDFLINHLPQQVRVVISTRVDPPISLHRLRVRGEITEIRENELRFKGAEAELFFSDTMKIIISKENVALLQKKTEGWVAGLQMAAVSLKSSVPDELFISSFTGSNRYIVDYLMEEVIKRQSSEVQDFLLKTSVLLRLNSSLCNEVLKKKNSADIIDYLDRSNLFVTPLNAAREWFRYHHLFSELLRYRLKKNNPTIIDDLYLRASKWYEKNEDIESAIEYARLMKDISRKVYLLDVYGADYVKKSKIPSLLKYMEDIPDELIKRHPSVFLVKVWALLTTHQLENPEDLLAQFEESLSTIPEYYTSEMFRDLQGQTLVLKAFILRLRDKLQESIEISNEALDKVSPDETLLRGLLSFNLAISYIITGDVKEAAEMFNAAISNSRKAGNYYIVLAALAFSGYLCAKRESVRTARLQLEESLEYAEKNSLDDLPATGYILYQLGDIYYQLNELDKAHEVLQHATELGILGNEPNVICYSLLLNAKTYAAQGSGVEARKLLDRVEEIDLKIGIKAYAEDINRERLNIELMLGDHDNVERLLEKTGFQQSGALIKIQMELSQKRYENALKLIGNLREQFPDRGLKSLILSLDLLEAIGQFGLKQKDDAFQLLSHALDLADAEGYLRTVIDLGKPMKRLLEKFSAAHNVPAFVRGIAVQFLKRFGEAEFVRSAKQPKFAQSVDIPLTEREQEVLYYLAKGYQNKRIANSMYISLDTVKSHLKNVYGKLGVKNRGEAVSVGKRTGLIS